MTDSSSLYPKKVMDHLKNPKNMGEIKDADGVATVGNPVCGDIMRLYVKIAKRKTSRRSRGSSAELGQNAKREEKYIEDIKFQTLGCGAAIASSSMLTMMVQGKSLKNALKVSRKDIAEALGGLPKEKMHCSVLAAEALKRAIDDYRSRQ